MDIASIITIIIAAVVFYLIIRFIINPLVKLILGIVIFIVLIYLLQRFGISPVGTSLNWLLNPINNFIDQAKNFLNSIKK